MADDSTVTIRASFSTREAADLAVEHLVQQQGVSRPDIFIQSATGENTSGRVHPAATPPTKTARVMTAPSTATSRFRSISLRIKLRLFNAFSETSER